MPVVKDGDVKQELLNAAKELFYEKGYDDTSVNSITEKVGVSKGAFYHYFQSKEDVLEEVTNQYIEKEIKITRETANDTRLNAREKINRLINEVLVHKALNKDERQKISNVFEHEGNIKFLRKLADNKIRILNPLYRAIIEEGSRDGYFDTIFPEEAAEQVIHLVIILNSMITKLASGIGEKPDNIKVIKIKVEAYQEAIARILGTEKGSIDFSEVIRVFETS